MAESISPRQIIKGLLEGVAPPRPLFLPMVFSHGASIENLPVRTFLTNPTKIANSLRQIRAHLRSDGITCYFDPFLEAEELGGVLHWEAEGQTPMLRWPQNATRDEGVQSGSFSAPIRGSRVTVAVEVIRRLKSVVRDDCLLTAGVTGPFTLAALLSQLDPQGGLPYADIAASTFDLAAAVISGIAKAFAEAGANVIWIREEVIPALSAEQCADWSSQLATTINIARFYQALPVLLLTDIESIEANRDVILQQHWDCVVCPALNASAAFPELSAAGFGVAISLGNLATRESNATELDDTLRRVVSELRPSIITTTGDISSTADVERLNKLWENVRR
jgi:Uroporphyrinogen decarboxylase (URO-D)